MTVAEHAAEGTAADTRPVHTRALIIGTGFSGLGMAIALQKQGVEFLILEKADEIGGTWRDNSYPGCACDVPSHLYSFSFEPKATWSKLFSPQPEILDYLKGVTDKYGLRRYIRFNSRAARAHWDDTEYRWHVFTDSGQEYVAQFLISGAGALHIPRLPDIEGTRRIPRRCFPFRAVGPRRRPHRQAGRGHRHRRQRHPDRARDRRRGRRTAALPAHPALGGAATERARFRDGCKTRVRKRSRDCAWRCATGIYWFLEGLGYAMTKRPSLLRAVAGGGYVEHPQACQRQGPAPSPDADISGRL